MKIAINTGDTELYNTFAKTYKKIGHEPVNVRSESTLFEHIRSGDIDAFVLDNDISFLKKAIDLIKRVNPYTPIIVVIKEPIGSSSLLNADTYMNPGDNPSIHIFLVLHNLSSYYNAFNKLKTLLNKPKEKIDFLTFTYDPSRRILYNNDIEVKKFSIKEGGILELLAINYKELVKKDLILEKVWRKNDYFTGRSCDVYVTYLRNAFKKHSLDLQIKNISGVGLILE